MLVPFVGWEVPTVEFLASPKGLTLAKDYVVMLAD